MTAGRAENIGLSVTINILEGLNTSSRGNAGNNMSSVQDRDSEMNARTIAHVRIKTMIPKIASCFSE